MAGSQCTAARQVFRAVGVVVFLGLTTLPALGDTYSSNASEEVISAAIERMTQAYQKARQRYLQETNTAEAAWQFSRACYECADLETNGTQRTQRAQEGIEAAQKAIALNAGLAPAYYFLGLSQGQLARSRSVSALGLIKDMERSWAKAVTLDPAFDFAGAHRALGILHRDTPGWPLSIGNRRKAEQHLEKAFQLAPDYPENFISLLESYLKWGQKQAVRTNLSAMQKTLDAARARFAGDTWKLDWHDWDHRWKKIADSIEAAPLKSPREQ